jgi:hypothetical protein
MEVICGLLGNYTASCGNYLPTFRDNVSIPSSRVEIQEAMRRRKPKINIKMDLQEVGWGAWTGLIWLRIGTGGGLL